MKLMSAFYQSYEKQDESNGASPQRFQAVLSASVIAFCRGH